MGDQQTLSGFVAAHLGSKSKSKPRTTYAEARRKKRK